MKLHVNTSYAAGDISKVEIPDIQDFEQIESWYVKWDNFCSRLKGSDTFQEIPLNTDLLNLVDWKRPMDVEIYPHDEENDEPDYGCILDHQD